MEETKNSDAPSPDTESQSFKQNYAGTFAAKCIDEQKQTIHAKQESEKSKGEPIPMELKRILDWIKNPINHSTVIAGFTGLIFFATAAYAVIATLQWDAMRGQLQEMKVRTM